MASGQGEQLAEALGFQNGDQHPPPSMRDMVRFSARDCSATARAVSPRPRAPGGVGQVSGNAKSAATIQVVKRTKSGIVKLWSIVRRRSAERYDARGVVC